MKLYTNEDWLYNKYILEEKSSIKIAEDVGVSKRTVLKYLNKYGLVKLANRQSYKRVLKLPYYVVVNCNECGKQSQKNRNYYKRRIKKTNKFYCDRECADEAHSKRIKGINNPNYGGSWNGPDPRKIFTSEERSSIGKRSIDKLKEEGLFEKRMELLQEGHKKFFSTEEGRKARARSGVASMMKQSEKGYRTSIEVKMSEELDKRDVEYIEQYNLGNKFIADFYIPEYNLIIECDGDYWHTLPKTVERDKRKSDYVEGLGYTLYRFWETDINNSIKDCVDNIKELGSNKGD